VALLFQLTNAKRVVVWIMHWRLKMFQFRHHNRLKYPQKHILICEDDLTQQKRILEHFLVLFEPQGDVQISVVPGALMAAGIISSTKVDLILLDHDMPQGNGSDLLIWLTQQGRSIPVITFSGIPQNNAHMGTLGASCSSFGKEDVITGKADTLIQGIVSSNPHLSLAYTRFPNNTGVAEQYVNSITADNRVIPRYWITPTLLVGGDVIDFNDWVYLRDTFGIVAVLNANARPDPVGIPDYLCCPVNDDGTGFPKETIRQIATFANQYLDKPMYVHCHLGFSRSPHYVYTILRACYKMPKEEALSMVLRALPSPDHHWGFNQHTTSYMKSIEDALTEVSQ
jgi:CheY-like chemotaxis protein